MRAALLLQCADRPGIVAAVGAYVAEHGGNVVEADQHSDPAAGLFLQRVEFEVDAARESLRRAFEPLASQFSMEWSLHDLDSRPRVAVLASRQGHCLADLLVRDALGELPGEIVLVVSNHDTHAALVVVSTWSSATCRSETTATSRSARSERCSIRPRPTSSCSRVICACCHHGSSTRGYAG